MHCSIHTNQSDEENTRDSLNVFKASRIRFDFIFDHDATYICIIQIEIQPMKKKKKRREMCLRQCRDKHERDSKLTGS